MGRASAFTALLLAWLCAQASMMDALQVFAWARMFAGYAQVMSWTAAAGETFDPAKPCELCLAIRHARAAEEKSPAPPLPPDAPKIVLFTAAVEEVGGPAERPMRFAPLTVSLREWRAPVPTPPPRIARG